MARQSQLATELTPPGASSPSRPSLRAASDRPRRPRFVGHGLAAVMLQVTSARHVLRRDRAAAEEALWSAEEVGRRSMRELRRTVALLRSEDEAADSPPLLSSGDIPALVDDARAGGSPSSCGREATCRGSPRASGSRSTGSARRRWRMPRGTRRARGPSRDRAGRGAGVSRRRDDRTNGLQNRFRAAATPVRPGRDAERATALGGEFAAGPTTEGWRVSCRLPLEAKEAVRAGDMRTP